MPLSLKTYTNYLYVNIVEICIIATYIARWQIAQLHFNVQQCIYVCVCKVCKHRLRIFDIPYNLKFSRTKNLVVCQISLEKVVFVIKFLWISCSVFRIILKISVLGAA